MGAFVEFVYGATLERGATLTVEQYAQAMRAVGPDHCIMSTDLGGGRPYPRPLPAAGLLEFMTKLRALGFSVAEIDQMSKTNPATVLGLER
jgi:predicted TIM-barrel fold metal-dependent hydrolase